MSGVAPPDDPAGDREPLEDGAVSEAQDACRESGGGDRRQNGHERPDGVAVRDYHSRLEGVSGARHG